MNQIESLCIENHNTSIAFFSIKPSFVILELLHLDCIGGVWVMYRSCICPSELKIGIVEASDYYSPWLGENKALLESLE
jgi:hypothetical protein